MNETYTQRLRVTFVTDESVKYVGHLDMARTWERAIRRARLPLAYTQGFNPQARIQFASALPLGFTSQAELVDVFLNEELIPDEVMLRLAGALTAGCAAHVSRAGCREEPSLQSQLTAARYRVEIETDEPGPAFQERLAGFLGRETACRERRRGKEISRYDLRPLVLDLRYAGPCSLGQSFVVLMRSDPGASGRPDELLAEFGYGEAPRRIVRLELAFKS